MNRRQVALLAMVLSFLAGTGQIAWGQPATLAQLPPTITASNSLSAADVALIGQYVKEQVAGLTSNDDAQIKRSRESLIAPAARTGATIEFQTEYCRALNAELAAPAKAKDLRARLNAAIVTARVASLSSNGALEDRVRDFLVDSNEGVKLWGLRGAKWVIPWAKAQNLGGAKPLWLLIEPVVRETPTGLMVQEAYGALALDLNNKRVVPAQINLVLPEILKLFKMRLEQWKKGIPEDPSAELKVISFLSDPGVVNVWSPTPAAQTEITQLILNLIHLAAQHNAHPASGPRATQSLWEIVRNGGQAFHNLIGPKGGLNDQGLVDASRFAAMTKSNDAPAAIQGSVDDIAKYLTSPASVVKGIVAPPDPVRHDAGKVQPATRPG